jgi:hypothetical protein
MIEDITNVASLHGAQLSKGAKLFLYLYKTNSKEPSPSYDANNS